MLVMQSATEPNLESFEDGFYYGRKIPSTLNSLGYNLGAWTLILDHRMLIRERIKFDVVGNLPVNQSKIGCGRYGGILTKDDQSNLMFLLCRQCRQNI